MKPADDSSVMNSAHGTAGERAPLPLTPALSQRERENGRLPFRLADARWFAARRDTIYPLPRGEGRGEGKTTNYSWHLLAVLLLALVGGSKPAAQETNASTNASAQLDYSSFRIITDRNIFNANRSGRSSRGRDSRRPARVEAFTLVGTLSYEKGRFAFFDGTSSEFKKALQLEGAIAGYKVKDIRPHGVALAAGTNRIELRVGMQMRREDEGEWQVRAQSETYASAGSASAGSSASSQTAASGDGGDVSDIVRRLMQQREKESK